MSRATLLNPCAQEWTPTPNTLQLLLPPHVIFTPHSPPPPPQTAVQAVPFAAAPSLKLPCRLPHQLPFYRYQCFSSQSQPAYHSFGTVIFSPPYGCYYEAAPSGYGGGAEMIKGPKGHPVALGKNVTPPRLRRAMWSFSNVKKATLRREWRRKKSIGGGADATSPASSEKSTVMIKNIPNQLRRDFMLEFLDSYCKSYSLEYDFLYLPMDFRKMDNLGYAFVNFTSGDGAQKLKQLLQNYRWGTVKTESGSSFTSRKICEITWARIQGKEGLIKRFENSTFACDRVGFLPVVLDPPRNGSDPNPAPPLVLGRCSHKRVLGKN